MNLSKGDGQGGLACCSPWGYEESDTSEQPNWTERNWSQNSACHKWRAVYLITKETTISIIIIFIITDNNNSIMTIVNWVFIVLWWGGGYAKQWKYFINTTLSSIIISVLHTRTLKLKGSWYKVVNDTDKNTRVTSVYDKVYSQIPKAAGFPRCSKDPTETHQRHINGITHLQFNQVCFPSLHWKLKLKTFQQVPGVDEMFQLSLHRALGQASGCQVNERRNSGSELSLQRELNCSLNRGRGGQKFSSI